MVVVALTVPAPVPRVAATGAATRDSVVADSAAASGPEVDGAAAGGTVAVDPVARGATQSGDPGTVRILVHAVNRSRALTRLRNLGLRSVYLRGNAHPPTPDEITAVLHHPEGLIWRTAPLRGDELWHPIRSLFQGPEAERRPSHGAGRLTSSGPGPGSRVTAAIPSYLVPKPLTVPEAWTASGA
jgi:hypothetical protein